MKPPALPDGLRLTGARPLTGGSICAVWRGRLDDGRDVVVKQTPYPAAVEVEGLAALAAAGAPVPRTIAAAADVLVLEYVRASPDWSWLGRAVADLHRTTGDAFGWHRDNLIGPLPQRNGFNASWPTFYAERRIRPLLDAVALPSPVRARLERALSGPLQAVLDAGAAVPSLVHGDLWSGNIVDGRWLIDPAVHYADREFELAFLALFGGVPAGVEQAYQQAWPLPDGWRRRRPVLQLYHLLVHIELFGAGYVAPVRQRLDALGW